MKKLLFLIFILLSTSNAETVFSSGFESGINKKDIKCSGNCPIISNELKKSGNSSAKFVLTPQMKTNYRTEAILTKGQGHFKFDKEYTIELDYRYEDWKQDSNGESAPFQIHTSPATWGDKKCAIRNPSGTSTSARATAPIFMISKNGQVEIVTYPSKVQWTGPIQTKQWLNLVVHFKISTGKDGFIEVWKDGKKLFKVNGANSPASDSCGRPVREPYFKMGVYKWDWKRKATDSTRRELLIDNLKISTGSTQDSTVTETEYPAPETIVSNSNDENNTITDSGAVDTNSNDENNTISNDENNTISNDENNTITDSDVVDTNSNGIPDDQEQEWFDYDKASQTATITPLAGDAQSVLTVEGLTAILEVTKNTMALIHTLIGELKAYVIALDNGLVNTGFMEGTVDNMTFKAGTKSVIKSVTGKVIIETEVTLDKDESFTIGGK